MRNTHHVYLDIKYFRPNSRFCTNHYAFWLFSILNSAHNNLSCNKRGSLHKRPLLHNRLNDRNLSHSLSIRNSHFHNLDFCALLSIQNNNLFSSMKNFI